MQLKIAPLISEPARSLSWALQPILNLMTFIGVPLPVQESASFWSRLLLGLYTFSWLTFNVASNASLISLTPNRTQEASEFTTSTSSHAKYIYFVNQTVSVIGIHVALLIGTRRKWFPLWLTLQRIETRMSPSWQLCRRVRNVSLVAVIYVLAHESLMVGLLCYHLISEDWPVGVIMLRAMRSFMNVFNLSAFVIFSLLAWVLSSNLRHIAQQIDQFRHSSDARWGDDLASQLLSWQQHFTVVCRGAHQWNDCFGLVLLIYTTSIFVDVISSSFFLLLKFLAFTGVNPALVINLMEKLAHLWITCTLADQIRGQSLEISKALVRLHARLPSFNQAVSDLMSHTFQMTPKTTAMGYFTISRHLIPKLVGTFLTYFIILYQFQSSERRATESP